MSTFKQNDVLVVEKTPMVMGDELERRLPDSGETSFKLYHLLNDEEFALTESPSQPDLS